MNNYSAPKIKVPNIFRVRIDKEVTSKYFDFKKDFHHFEKIPFKIEESIAKVTTFSLKLNSGCALEKEELMEINHSRNTLLKIESNIITLIPEKQQREILTFFQSSKNTKEQLYNLLKEKDSFVQDPAIKLLVKLRILSLCFVEAEKVNAELYKNQLNHSEK